MGSERLTQRWDPNINRYGHPYMQLDDDGSWVRYHDYAALEARIEALEAALRGIRYYLGVRSELWVRVVLDMADEALDQPKIACRLHGMSEAVVLPNGHRECWLCVKGALER